MCVGMLKSRRRFTHLAAVGGTAWQPPLPVRGAEVPAAQQRPRLPSYHGYCCLGDSQSAVRQRPVGKPQLQARESPCRLQCYPWLIRAMSAR